MIKDGLSVDAKHWFGLSPMCYGGCDLTMHGEEREEQVFGCAEA